MIVNPPENTAQNAEVLFIIETTAVAGAYISELRNNYIIPTLEYFHGGPIEEGSGGGTVYGIVTYKAADCLLVPPVSAAGPFTCPQSVLEEIDKIQFVGGQMESRACIAEALATAADAFDDLGRGDVPQHAVLLCCSAPYGAYGGGIVPPGTPMTLEAMARALAGRGVQSSVVATRRLGAFTQLFEWLGGDVAHAAQRNFSKDGRHMVLLRGYSLKERPPSPAPPPVPDIQTMADVYGGGRGQPPTQRPPVPGAVPVPPAAGGFPRAAPPPAGAGRAGWGGLPPRQPLYAGNSALLTQLAQPSYPPPPPQVNQAQRLPSMVGAGQPQAGAAPPQRQYIWSGVLEWIEKGKGPGDQQKVTKMLPCQVSANSKDIEPELKVDTWPSTLLMQLMPKQLISNIGGQYLKDSKSVLFHLQPNEALDALTKVMVNGFAGCVHFSSPSQCDIKVLILLYTPDKKAYLGFIPNNQVTFVDRLRKVIQQQKITQIINKQMPTAGPSGAMPAQNMPGGSGTMPGLGMSVGGAGGMGGLPAPAQQIQPPAQHQHQQGMMMSAGPGVGGVGGGGGAGGAGGAGGGKAARPSQLDGLEAARQQNLEKIQHLQQTLEAAHQQELQFKSQMDIMSHLQAAQQQELGYKQLEEQQRKQQQQQFQQQQLRGAAGAGGVGGVLPHAAHAAHATHAAHAAHAAHQPRIMRPMMPSNPGLRHLLQQQPYRPGSAAPRPATQQQQFEDVNNYDFL